MVAFGAAQEAESEPWDDAGSDQPLVAEAPEPGSVTLREEIPELQLPLTVERSRA